MSKRSKPGVPRRRPFTVRLTAENYELLQATAAGRKQKLQDLVNAAIESYLRSEQEIFDTALQAHQIEKVDLTQIGRLERDMIHTLLGLMREGPEDARDVVLSSLRYVRKQQKLAEKAAQKSLKLVK